MNMLSAATHRLTSTAPRRAALASAILLAGALISAPAARADSIGIDFNGGNANSTLDASTNAGIVIQNNWNGFGSTSGTNLALNNNLGAATGTTLTYFAENVTAFGSVPQGGDEQLNNGAIYSGTNSVISFTLNNISYDTYDIYVYNIANGETQQITTLGPTSFYGISPYVTNPNYVDANAETPYTYTQTTSTSTGTFTPNANYARFTGLSGTIQNFSVTSTNSFGVVGAIQLVNTTVAPVPEPSTWAMMFLGVGAMGLVIRRKRATEV